ncbi:hypothetical protein ADL32_08475, partial [Streptomyces albidoflavus]|uniref:MFS transporter n=1 Tax=Streptomyces albidoflavus TaxID=1886 RepID=UPI000743CB57
MRRAARVVGRALRTPVTGPARGIRKVTHAQGAGESGLGRLIELHGVNGAGDVMITVALASTVFFSVPTDEARGRVALYLAVTMLPFTLLAPVVGPLLDRLPHGRRAAMAGSMLARAVLALVLSGAVATGSLEMYPAALGVLVASKAYGVVRSAVVPRLLPQGFSLVKANSRVTLGGLLATGVAAPVGAGLQMIGPGWPLYGACLLFLGGAFLSFRLPPKVDSARGERRALLAADEQHLAAAVDARWDPVATDDKTDDKTDSTDNKEEEKDRDGERGDGERGKGKERRRKGPGLRTVGPAVTHALAANACVRCQSGFLIFFLAFLLREHPLTGQSAAVSLAVVGVAAGAGDALGTAVGAWLRARAPEVIIVTVVGALVAVAVSAAGFFGAAGV